jgi:protein TonB
MSAFSNNAILHMPWSYSDEEDGRFNRIVRTSLAVSLVFSILMPLLPLTIIEKEIIEEPPRLVTLIFEKKPVAPPPKPKPVVRKPRPLPKKAEKPKPVKQVKKTRKPEPVDKTVAARSKAKKSGLLALTDSLSDLRQNTRATSLKQTSALSHSGGQARKTERAVLTSNTASTSGGISTASLSRNTGGGALASRATTQVHSPVGNAAGASSGSGRSDRAAGRSIEEIQMVFDRNKGIIYSVYNRALRKDPSLQGKIVLQLTIAPSGKVLHCKLISSELNAPSLGQNITKRVKLFDFGAREVSEVTITYPIDFLPA